MKIRTSPLRELSISDFQRMVPVVDLHPAYQREGGVWKSETRARLIDSILNGLDVPKLYFERESRRRSGPEGLTIQYAVIDGKQRLEAILEFLDDKLRLPDDFIFFEDESVKAAGMTLSQLYREYENLARRFLDFELPVVTVSTDSGDLIEEMFQRLNASSSLNAAERRNALLGPTRTAANALAEHLLLIERSPIRNARYKYRELGAKFLAIEHQLDVRQKIIDTKAETLYALFAASRGTSPEISEAKIEEYRNTADATLSRMVPHFEPTDPLLSSIGTVVVYYIAFRDAEVATICSRAKLADFENLRRGAAAMAEEDPQYARPANARLREYNVFVQSTNDGRALSRRAEILSRYLRGYQEDNPLAGLDGVVEAELTELPDSDSSEE